MKLSSTVDWIRMDLSSSLLKKLICDVPKGKQSNWCHGMFLQTRLGLFKSNLSSVGHDMVNTM